MMRYRVEKIGSMLIEANSEEEAEQKAEEMDVSKWNWGNAEAEEW